MVKVTVGPEGFFLSVVCETRAEAVFHGNKLPRSLRGTAGVGWGGGSVDVALAMVNPDPAKGFSASLISPWRVVPTPMMHSGTEKL